MNFLSSNLVVYLIVVILTIGCSTEEERNTQRSSAQESANSTSQSSKIDCRGSSCAADKGDSTTPNSQQTSELSPDSNNNSNEVFTQIKPNPEPAKAIQETEPEEEEDLAPELLDINFQLSDWQDYCKLTFNEPFSHPRKLPVNINAGDTFLISQMPITLRSSGGIVASILVPYKNGVILYKLNTQNAQLFTTDCENTEYQYYLVALANTRVYSTNQLNLEICELQKGDAKVHGGFSSWLHIEEKTYSINLDVYSDQCNNPNGDDYFIQANSGLSLSSAQIPIRSLVRPFSEN